MDVNLIAPDNPLGYPAPYWFLVFFKVLGFVLHIVPMNLWYAGLFLMLLIRLFGSEHGRRLSERVTNAMPVIIAFGVNFGIVPLLFTQVAYYKVFYPATILIAWFWFSVFVLLTFAYYGIYYYVIGLRKGDMPFYRHVVGWMASFLFIFIGFVFANNFSLMTNIGSWADLWDKTSIGGAALGTALNIGDKSLLPRWLMMFGLAITTTAAFVVVDAGFFAKRESDEYKRWLPGLALKLYSVGLVWFALAGSWYFFGALKPQVRDFMINGPLIILTALTALSPGLPWLIILASRKGVTRTYAFLAGFAQFGVIALNAISRQIVQNRELAPYLDVTGEKVNMQWSPMIIFLLLFVAGIGVVVWMVMQIFKNPRETSSV